MGARRKSRAAGELAHPVQEQYRELALNER